MTHIMAPIVPHLAEEIHAQRHGKSSPSVFTVPWVPLVSFANILPNLSPAHPFGQPQEWNLPQAEKDMNPLLGVRNVVLSLLEKARSTK